MEKLQPDVIVLFGSAARNTMREGSDIDLLALRNARERGTRGGTVSVVVPGNGR